MKRLQPRCALACNLHPLPHNKTPTRNAVPDKASIHLEIYPMSTDLPLGKSMDGKVIIVMGAGSVGEGWGNGKAAAVLYARAGGKIVAVDRKLSAAEETRSIIESEGGECITVEADVSSPEDIQRIVAETVARFGRIDVLHNNVGIAETGGPEDASIESWNRLIAINQTSVFLTCKYVLPVMKAQKSGVVINIGSIASRRWIGFPYLGYTASKAAIVGMTQNIAVEYAPHGVRCNCILPGLMDTPMIREPLKAAYGGDIETMKAKRHAQVPPGRMGDAGDVAYAALFLASDHARYITGVELPVDGGLTLKCV